MMEEVSAQTGGNFRLLLRLRANVSVAVIVVVGEVGV